MATKSVTQLTEIKCKDGVDIGLSGLLRILMLRTYRGGPNYNSVGALTDEELVTIANQARNVHTAALEGLATVGTLVSCFNPQRDDMDRLQPGRTRLRTTCTSAVSPCRPRPRMQME